MPNFPQLFLIATVVSDVLFGIFINIAGVCARIFYQKIKAHQVNHAHLGSFVAIALLCCAKVILDNVLTVQAFSNISDGEANYPSFGSSPMMTLNVLWVMETLVADAFITYRVWIVYRRNSLVIIAPCILLFGSLVLDSAVGIVKLYFISTFNHGEFSVVLERVHASATAFVSTTLALNILCTSLISYRIWRVRSDVSAVGATRSLAQGRHKDPVKRIVSIIIESAAIYTLVLFFYIILIGVGSDLNFIIVPIISPLIAVVFGSIIVRSARGEDTVGQTTSADQKHHGTSAGVYGLRSGRGTGDQRLSRNPISGLQVQLSTVVTSKVDGEGSEHTPYGDAQASGDTKYPQM